jgi:hypothetical protein
LRGHTGRAGMRPRAVKHARVSLGEDASAHPVARRRPRRRRAVCVHLRAACEGDRGLRAVVGGLSGPPAVAGSLSAAQRAAGDPGAGCVLGTAGGPRRGRRESPREGSLIGCVWCTLLQYYRVQGSSPSYRAPCGAAETHATLQSAAPARAPVVQAALSVAAARTLGVLVVLLNNEGAPSHRAPCGAAETHSTLQSAAPAQGAPCGDHEVVQGGALVD